MVHEWTTEAQEPAHAQGMCGKTLPGNQICILPPGHGNHDQLDALDEVRRLTALASYANRLTYLALAVEALTDEVEQLRSAAGTDRSER